MEWSELVNAVQNVLNFTLFELNQTPVTISSIVMFILMMAVFFFFSRLLNRVVVKNLLTRLGVEESTRFVMIRVNHYLIMIIGAIVSFQFIGIDLSGLAVIFGLLSVGIGFGLQNITSNFIAGIILLIERPIKISDRVTVGETEGDVMDINIRSTTIRTLNNISIIVPNSEFVSNNVTNWSHGDQKIRMEVAVGVSYNSDIDVVLRCLKEVADNHSEVLKVPPSDILFREFGDSSWNLGLRVWIPDPKRHHIIRSELNIAIVRKFRENKVEIPFPQRDLHLRSPEKLVVNNEAVN